MYLRSTVLVVVGATVVVVVDCGGSDELGSSLKWWVRVGQSRPTITSASPPSVSDG
jgi:hypothetical protein